MRKYILWSVNIVLSAILLFALANFLYAQWEGYLSRKNYEQALQLAVSSPSRETVPAETVIDPVPTSSPPTEATAPEYNDPVIEELLAIDLSLLRETNEDIIGWICIPDTAINYPLLQWTDNEFYLTHTWDQTKNASGSIFMECQNLSDFSQFNTILYGHNMRNGTMFSSLHLYADIQYLQEHPCVYIASDRGVFRYDFFAVQSANIESAIYGFDIETDFRKKEFIRFALDYSRVDTGITPTTEDRILTLSTCTGTGYQHRWVVLGVLNEAGSYIRPTQ